MITKTHEYFSGFLRKDIERQIFQLSKDFPTALEFCEALRLEGTPFNFENGNSSHAPDIHVSHRRAKFPTVLFEIAHSQTKKELSQLAKACMRCGNVKMVVGLTTGYNHRKATVDV